MILKELDPFHGGDDRALAARISADRMAYYLSLIHISEPTRPY